MNNSFPVSLLVVLISRQNLPGLNGAITEKKERPHGHSPSEVYRGVT